MQNINFVSLEVKCPHCSHSLMDPNQKVDNEESIKLIVEGKVGRGTIHLSSIYGSYNFISTIPFEDHEIVKFFCPHCKKELKSHEHCTLCHAHMVTLILDMGGKVSFCSRKGCQNHNIGFEDLALAMKKLYQEFGYLGRNRPEDTPLHYHKETDVKEQTEEEQHKEIIETGSFLMSYLKCTPFLGQKYNSF